MKIGESRFTIVGVDFHVIAYADMPVEKPKEVIHYNPKTGVISTTEGSEYPNDIILDIINNVVPKDHKGEVWIHVVENEDDCG